MSCRVLFVCLCVFSLTILGGCKGSGSDSSGGKSSSSQSASVGKSPGGSADNGSDSSPVDSGGDKPSTATSDTASKSDPDQADPDQADPDQADPDKSDPNKSDPNKSDPNKSDPNKSDPNKSDPDQSDGSTAGSNPNTAAHITDVDVQNYGSHADGVTDVTFGQVFADGVISKQQSVVAVADGKVLPTQVDRKATWSNGSLRHAIITVQLNAPGPKSSRSLALYVVDDAADSGFDTLKLGDLLGTNFSAEIKVTRAGTTYTANARRALERVAQTGKCPSWGQPSCKRWLTGGLASEWIVPVKLTHGNSSLPRLRVYFNVRAYRGANGGVGNVRVDTIVENDLTYVNHPNDVSYTATIQVGDNSYDVDLTHGAHACSSKKHPDAPPCTQYAHTRWHHVLWMRPDPHLYARISTAYLQSTGAISKYAKLSPSNAFLNSVRQKVAPMRRADQTRYMGSTGAQAAIGPLPRWTSTYVVSNGDRRAFNWMLANDDGVGSYGFHYRDNQTGRPVTIVDHPDISIAVLGHGSATAKKYGDDLLPSCSSDCHNPNSFDISHHPSIGYVPYLVTGDFYYLEEMQFAASYVELWANPKYRKYQKGALLGADSQVRGQAWSLRSISDAAFATPDADPMKPYFVNQIDYIIKDYLDNYVDDPGHPLHALDTEGAVKYPAGQVDTGIATWQEDFFTWAVGHAAEQKVPGAQRLINWLAKFQIGLMTSAKDGDTDGFCWIKAAAYYLNIRASNTSPVYKSLDEVYDKQYPDLAGLKCASQEMANQLSLKVGEMTGYSKSPTGFPSNLQIGLAVAADTSDDDARKAWQVFSSRSVKPDYSQYPNFALVPRWSN